MPWIYNYLYPWWRAKKTFTSISLPVIRHSQPFTIFYVWGRRKGVWCCVINVPILFCLRPSWAGQEEDSLSLQVPGPPHSSSSPAPSSRGREYSPEYISINYIESLITWLPLIYCCLARGREDLWSLGNSEGEGVGVACEVYMPLVPPQFY